MILLFDPTQDFLLQEEDIRLDLHEGPIFQTCSNLPLP